MVNGMDVAAATGKQIADSELRLKMADAEIKAVLEKYAVQIMSFENRVNGQVVAAGWRVAAQIVKAADSAVFR